jgi:hypothetical protein
MKQGLFMGGHGTRHHDSEGNHDVVFHADNIGKTDWAVVRLAMRGGMVSVSKFSALMTAGAGAA